jgi:hypothetical protein
MRGATISPFGLLSSARTKESIPRRSAAPTGNALRGARRCPVRLPQGITGFREVARRGQPSPSCVHAFAAASRPRVLTVLSIGRSPGLLVGVDNGWGSRVAPGTRCAARCWPAA